MSQVYLNPSMVSSLGFTIDKNCLENSLPICTRYPCYPYINGVWNRPFGYTSRTDSFMFQETFTQLDNMWSYQCYCDFCYNCMSCDTTTG